MTTPTSQDPLSYTGINIQAQPAFISVNRAPTVNDWQSFEPGFRWRDTSQTPPDIWENVSVANRTGIWRKITNDSTDGVSELTADSGTNPVLPDINGNINILGGPGITTVGSANTITINSSGGSGDVETLEGNTGGPVSPTSPGGNISILGQGNVTVTGVPISNELDVSLTGITDHAVLVGGPSNAIQNKLLTDGQVLIGSTGADPVAASLTAGANITITPGAGSITIASTGGGSGGFSSINRQVLTATGSYTPSAGLSFAYVECWAGGGAGGGSIASPSIGGGGAAGEYRSGYFDSIAIGVSQAVTIGAGGIGNTGVGTAGGNTSFGALITANGGPAGTTNASVPSLLLAPYTAGGSGGSGGTLNINGGYGSYGFSGVAPNATKVFVSGAGGAPPFFSGVQGQTLGAGSSTLAGANAVSFGGGGGGAINTNFPSPSNGGNGASGVIVVTEYIT